MRSFHPTVAAGNAQCESLGFTDDQVEAVQSFQCKNCQYKQHQCFFCGKLGSSDEASNAEVFPCINATCGHFYHSECIVKLLHPVNEEQAKRVVERIAGGESFTCPVHKCFVCGQEEDKEVHELQFAMCRRCPKAYHRKCLPRGIPFENNFEKNILQRAWDGLLPNRILIYCLDHKIDKVLCTPIRNHIIFPRSDQEKKKHAQEQLSSREKVKLLVKKRKQTFGAFPAEETANKMLKLGQKCYGHSEKANFCQEVQKVRPGNDHPWRPTDNGVNSEFLEGCIMSISTKMASTEENKPRPSHPVGSSPLLVKQQNLPSRKLVKIRSAASMMKRPSSSIPLVDPALEKRVVKLMNKSTASLKFEDFMKKLKMPTSYISTKNSPGKFITHGKIERFVKAVKTALERLEEKHQSIEDAKAVCEPNILCELINWKTKLSIYLSPFLHGMRYTSFGRHFYKARSSEDCRNAPLLVSFCCMEPISFQLVDERKKHDNEEELHIQKL
ncbi:hypothetical protein RJ641_015165 [Dillenia turbinata]|uniref:Zinc finger PHD-type domain-containing protein n=1 Tax=Dillenia turbinata TaxID=194707 RepID=A0AAN8YZW4_9MAGN